MLQSSQDQVNLLNSLNFYRPVQLPSTHILCALVLILATTVLQGADSLRITPLVRNDRILVSFQLENNTAENLQKAIKSGLRTTITYTVDLRLEVPAWIDRTIATTIVSHSVQYDNLTRQHDITQTIDGRLEQAEVTQDDVVARRWLTSFQRVPLFDTNNLEPNREYYVRVNVKAEPGNSSMWPWAGGLSGQAKFTFIR